LHGYIRLSIFDTCPNSSVYGSRPGCPKYGILPYTIQKNPKDSTEVVHIYPSGSRLTEYFMGLCPHPRFPLHSSADWSTPVKDPSALRESFNSRCLRMGHLSRPSLTPCWRVRRTGRDMGFVGHRPAVPPTRTRLFGQSWSPSLVCRSLIYGSQFASDTPSCLR
jgi:hypothetical protein